MHTNWVYLYWYEFRVSLIYDIVHDAIVTKVACKFMWINWRLRQHVNNELEKVFGPRYAKESSQKKLGIWLS